MTELFRMPALLADVTDAVLASWQVPESQPYSAQDTIATVETDKAIVDVPAESAGVILKTLVTEGSRVEVGAPLALVGAPGERVENVDAVLAELGLSTPAGNGTPEPAETPALEPTQPTEPTEWVPASVPVAAARPSDPAARLFASPLARRLARDANIPLRDLTGTGPGGRVVRRDVEAAIARNVLPGNNTSTDAQVSASAAAAPVRTPPSPTAHSIDVPHTRVRQAIATRLTESKQSAPHFYLRGTARAGKLLKLRETLNAAGQPRVSVNDLVVKAVATAHTLVPAMNVIWTPEAVRSFESVDVAVAIATEHGLVTPVLRSVERMTITSVAAAVQDYVERARAGQLKQDELDGGTVTVTNLGMYGTEEFSAIINPPQSSILAVGAVREEPIVSKGRVKAASVLRVTLSVDHRPLDGVIAAEWMRAFISVVENPVRILA